MSGPGSLPSASVLEFEERARELLPPGVFDYYAGGAGDEWTIRENRRAFERYVLRPRVLVDVSSRELSTTVLGQAVSLPVLVAPIALQRMAHPEGELATARAAAAAGTVMTLSTLASRTIEEVAGAGGSRWFQLYVLRDRDLTAELVKRAEAAGYSAIVLTVDLPVLGWRDRDIRNDFSPPEGIEFANLLAAGSTEGERADLFTQVEFHHEEGLTWRDIEWVRSLTSLPLVLKGILTAEDARLALEAGVDGVVVSNHGGRQLDGSIGSFEALPEIVNQVDDRCEVYVDGGVRRGTDVLKALALGARAVLVGRPILWGLAVGGEEGVGRVFEILRGELDIAMALAGCRSVADVDRAVVARASS